MLHVAVQVVLYGLLAGFTALGFAATLTVMPSGRLKALGFGLGFVGAQSLTCSVLVIFGIAVVSKKSHPDLRAMLEGRTRARADRPRPHGAPQTGEHE